MSIAAGSVVTEGEGSCVVDIDIDASAATILEKLSEAVAAGNVKLSDMARTHAFVEEYARTQLPYLYAAVTADARWPALSQRYQQERAKWFGGLNDKATIDYYYPEDGTWYQIKILEVDPANRDKVYIHFNGWPVKYDKWIHLSESIVHPSGYRIKVRGTKGSSGTTKQPLLESGDASADVPVQASAVPDSDARIITDTVATAVVALSRSGRAIKANNSIPNFSRVGKRGANKFDALLSDISTPQDGHSGESIVSARPPKRSRQPKSHAVTSDGTIEEDHNEWVCAVCDRFEPPDGTDTHLILCDGPCMRSYHASCLTASNNKSSDNELGDFWLCADCNSAKHVCFICNQYGEDVLEVVKCSSAHCGKFYHKECLLSDDATFVNPEVSVIEKLYPASYLPPPVASTSNPTANPNAMPATTADGVTDNSPKRIRVPSQRMLDSAVKEPSKRGGNTKEKETEKEKEKEQLKVPQLVNSFTFKCPLHSCDTCTEFYTRYLKSMYVRTPLMACLRCPRAFHGDCIPPGSRWNSLCLLCPLHPNDVLPSKELGADKLGASELAQFWDQLVLPEMPVTVDNVLESHFKLPTHIQDEVSQNPTDFKLISKLDYDMLPDKERTLSFYPTEDVCKCIDRCDEHCLNRILNIECHSATGNSGTGNGNESSMINFKGKSGTSGSTAPLILKLCSNCSVAGSKSKDDNSNSKADCGNRCFQSKAYAKTIRIKEEQMGWGLKAAEDIAQGSLVIEYLGEVIDEREMIRRMEMQRKLTPTDHDFYIMELDQGYFVDGKFKGNYSRFINHSCDPNCELQRWVVKGRMHIGIFAIRDISADEPLSYDYQFDTNEADAFKCHCGTAICRGTMAPKKKIKIFETLPIRADNGLIDKERLSRLERMSLAALGREEQARQQDSKESEEFQLQRSYVSRFLPGDNINEIRNGPQRSSFRVGRSARLFLVRNIQSSISFLYRRRLMWEKAATMTFDEVLGDVIETSNRGRRGGNRTNGRSRSKPKSRSRGGARRKSKSRSQATQDTPAGGVATEVVAMDYQSAHVIPQKSTSSRNRKRDSRKQNQQVVASPTAQGPATEAVEAHALSSPTGSRASKRGANSRVADVTDAVTLDVGSPHAVSETGKRRRR